MSVVTYQEYREWQRQSVAQGPSKSATEWRDSRWRTNDSARPIPRAGPVLNYSVNKTVKYLIQCLNDVSDTTFESVNGGGMQHGHVLQERSRQRFDNEELLLSNLVL